MSRRGADVKMRSMTLRQLIQYAWSLSEHQMTTGPDWAGETRFDVAATITGETRPELRQILAERFRLELREENREMPAYAMSVVPGGHKLGKPHEYR